MKLITVICLFACCLMATVASAADESTILEFDFAPILAQQDYRTIDDLNAGTDCGFHAPAIEGYWQEHLRAADTASISELEKLRLGVLYIDEKFFKLGNLTYKTHVYFTEHGELPTSIFDFYPELANAEGQKAFMAMSGHDKIANYGSMVDPISGRFYQSLSATEWQSGTINIEYMDKDQGITWIRNYLDVPEGSEFDYPNLTDHLLVFTFWGEQPDSVLIYKYDVR